MIFPASGRLSGNMTGILLIGIPSSLRSRFRAEGQAIGLAPSNGQLCGVT